jgi:hypothetical protein
VPAEKVAVTPLGRPVAVPIPVTPVVVWTIFGSPVTAHMLGFDEAEADLLGVTVIVAGTEFTVVHDPF